MQYTRKVASIEAREHEGPKLVVISDSKGEQLCNTGDFLIGAEPGKVFVIAKADFLADFEPAAVPEATTGDPQPQQ
jgi:hypothetical protein